MVFVLSSQYPALDLRKMLSMALVHDLSEIGAGDVYILDSKGREGKKEREQKALQELLFTAPTAFKENTLALVREYEEKQTPEAKLVNACSKRATLKSG